MKLNKLQRFTAYCIMLAEAENNPPLNNGLCFLSRECFGNSNDRSDDFYFIQSMFMELKKICNGRTAYWWEQGRKGWKQRISALKQCIEETHP